MQSATFGSGTVTEFPIPRNGAFPHDPAVSADGTVWYTDQSNSFIGRMDPATGRIIDYPTPTPGSGPHGIEVAADGYVWYTGQAVGVLGRLNPRDGSIEEFSLPDNASHPHTPIIVGGTVWFTDANNNTYGRLDPRTGQVKVYTSTTPNSIPYGMRAAPDGSIWIAMLGPTSWAGWTLRRAPFGSFRCRRSMRGPRRLQVDRQGTVWYTDYQRGYLGALDPKTGRVREWRSPSPSAGPYGIALGTDGRIWYDESRTNLLVSFDPRTERMDTVRIPTSPAIVRHMVTDTTRHVIWLALSGTGRIGKLQL
jgi:virginiamycin B lyase